MAETQRTPEILASNEDGIDWVSGARSARHARRHVAEECGFKLRTLVAKPEHMRQAGFDDCKALGIRLDSGHHAARGEYEELPDDCVCPNIEEGWFYECDADHPDAIAVWRVEMGRTPWLSAQRWKLGNRLFGSDRVHRRSPVLWGGRVARNANRLDRLLGYRGIYVLGDRWLSLGASVWRVCFVCGGKRPHSAHDGQRGHCQAADHLDKVLGRIDDRHGAGALS